MFGINDLRWVHGVSAASWRSVLVSRFCLAFLRFPNRSLLQSLLFTLCLKPILAVFLSQPRYLASVLHCGGHSSGFLLRSPLLCLTARSFSAAFGGKARASPPVISPGFDRSFASRPACEAAVVFGWRCCGGCVARRLRRWVAAAVKLWLRLGHFLGFIC